MAPQQLDKLLLSICATVVVVTAWTLVIAGSFVPRWARPLNTTFATSNATYSLWGREDCYDYVCDPFVRKVYVETKKSWEDRNGKVHTKTERRVDLVTVSNCRPANFCNVTWFHQEEFENIPSLLFVSRAFIIPSIIAGFITMVLYILKIVMIVLRPLWRRIHIRAAYLTFSAAAGVSAGISVILFVVMIEDDLLELLWAPALPGVGAFLFICIALGGYLSWRNHSTDEEFDERSEVSDRTSNIYEFASAKSKGGITPKGYHRSTSNQSDKSDAV